MCSYLMARLIVSRSRDILIACAQESYYSVVDIDIVVVT